jgi:hypothetical protein
MKTFKNTEYGIEAHLVAHSKGFAVSLMDTDSGEFVNEVRIYANEADAIAYAQKLVA